MAYRDKKEEGKETEGESLFTFSKARIRWRLLDLKEE